MRDLRFRWVGLVVLGACVPVAIAACSGDDSTKSSPFPGTDAATTDSTSPAADAQAGDDASTDAGGDAHPSHDASDAASDSTASDASDGAIADAGPGHVVFKNPDDHWYRLAATPGATPEDLSPVLDPISTGVDGYVNLSPDGQWLALSTARFSCASTECLGYAKADGTKMALATSGGQPIDIAGRPAISSGATVLVYPKQTGGGTRVDLFSITRTPGADGGDAWGPEVLLTGASPHTFHHDVAISSDGSKVVFDCGPSQYQAPATSICEVGTDGSNLHEAVSYKDGPSGADGGGTDFEVHHPAYAPDGSLVFESDWGAGGTHDETVWRRVGTSAPVLVSGAGADNDNSPCVLPNGDVASLWLGNVESDGASWGIHELKRMSSDGTQPVMLLVNIDLVDVGISCGE